MSGYARVGLYFGKTVAIACDGRCDKAWGINQREKHQLGEDVDDFEYLSDDELGKAPDDPGTYEGFQAKPAHRYQKLNKWCVRECERSVMVGKDELVCLPDFSKRVSNRVSITVMAVPSEIKEPCLGESREDIKDKVMDVVKANILNNLDDVNEDDIVAEISMKDLGANSLDIVEVVSCSMRDLKINVPRSDLVELKTIGELVDVLHHVACLD